MRKIEILSETLENVSGTAKSGKPFSFNKQTAYLHSEKVPYPEKTELIINDGQPPYTPGIYELHEDSIVLDRNGRLSVTPILVRKSDQKQTLAANK